MLGFFIGTTCLIGLFAVALGGRRWGHHHWRHHRRRGLYRAFERLDTTPGQEKAIRSALSDLMDSVGGMRSSLREARTQVAEAMRQDEFDPRVVHDAVDSRNEDLVEIQTAVASALTKIHDALDPDQRKRLARWVEAGPHAVCC